MKLNELKAKRVEVLASMKKLNADNPQMNVDTKAQYDTLSEQYNSLSRDIDIAQNENTLSAQVDPSIVAQVTPAAQTNNAITAMLAYARTGVIGDAQNAMQTGGSTNGAFLIPQTYADKILTGLTANSALRKHADVVVTNGIYNLPIAGSKPTFAWIDELGAYPTPDATVTNKTLEAWKAGGIIQVSEELLNDEQFNLEDHLKGLIVEGIASHEAGAFFTGNGVKKPLGMSSTIIGGNTKTVAALDTITLANVEDLFLNVKAGYRAKGTWIISDKFFKAIFRMKNANGDYIWTAGTTEGEPGKIFGRPYEVDDSLDGLTGKPLAYFGDMNAYKIGDRGELAIQRLNELYAADGMIGFKVFKRTDGKLALDEAIAVLNNA